MYLYCVIFIIIIVVNKGSYSSQMNYAALLTH